MLSATIAAVFVAALSFAAGRSWALGELQQRREAFQGTLQQASYPITESVAKSLALLLRGEVVVLDESRQVSASSIRLDRDAIHRLATLLAAESREVASGLATESEVRIGQQVYIASFFQRQRKSGSSATDRFVVVLFELEGIYAASRRAAMLPLLTGLSTIGLLSTVTLLITSGLATRITRLQQSVQLVASGDFDASVSDPSRDEIGRLGRAVDAMSSQLKALWSEVNRRQSDKLLHQLSAGMAHQLRNTLTGARLAIELHQQSHSRADTEIVVALRELTVAEDYVQRLLLVGTGEHRQEDRPAIVAECLSDLRSTQEIVAHHLGVELAWNWDDELEHRQVIDGATLSTAVSNLVINAIQAGRQVEVAAVVTGVDKCKIVVGDNGPGVAQDVADDLFEPFVTSKPEGMGLGLAAVRRAAKKLAGTIEWERTSGMTWFILTIPILPTNTTTPEH